MSTPAPLKNLVAVQKPATAPGRIATVTLRGVDLEVRYRLEGEYLAASSTDPEERPVCVVLAVECGGVDITNLSESVVEECALAIERELP